MTVKKMGRSRDLRLFAWQLYLNVVMLEKKALRFWIDQIFRFVFKASLAFAAFLGSGSVVLAGQCLNATESARFEATGFRRSLDYFSEKGLAISAKKIAEELTASLPGGSMGAAWHTARTSGQKFLKNFQSYRNLEILKKIGRSFAEIENLPPREQDRIGKVLLKRVFIKNKPLTARELALFKSRPSYERVFEAVEALHHQLELGEHIARGALKIVGKSLSVAKRLVEKEMPFEANYKQVRLQESRKKKVLKTLGVFLKGMINGPLRIALPMYMVPMRSEVQKIFFKQWENLRFFYFGRVKGSYSPVHWNKTRGFYEPTAKEWATLEKYGAKELFLKKREFLNSTFGRPWSMFRRWVSKSFKVTTIVASIFAVNYLVQISQGGVVDVQTHQSQIEYRLPETHIRFLTETTPFPHVAFQVGRDVISYGQTHVSSTSAYKYLNSKQIDAAREDRAAPVEEAKEWTSQEKIGAGLMAGVKYAAHVSGYSKFPRSVVVAELNVGEQGAQNMGVMGNNQIAKTYPNHTGIFDCGTMTAYNARAAGVNIPRLIDPYPSVIAMYLAMLKTLGVTNHQGEPLVTKIYQVTQDFERPAWAQMLMSTGIAAYEGKLAALFFPDFAVRRLYFEMIYGKEHYQNYEPQALEKLKEEYGMSGVNRVGNDIIEGYLKVFRSKVEKVSKMEGLEAVEKKKRLKNLIAREISEEIAKIDEILLEPETNLERLIQKTFSRHQLLGLKKQFFEQIDGRVSVESEFKFEGDIEAILKEIEETRMTLIKPVESSE